MPWGEEPRALGSMTQVAIVRANCRWQGKSAISTRARSSRACHSGNEHIAHLAAGMRRSRGAPSASTPSSAVSAGARTSLSQEAAGAGGPPGRLLHLHPRPGPRRASLHLRRRCGKLAGKVLNGLHRGNAFGHQLGAGELHGWSAIERPTWLGMWLRLRTASMVAACAWSVCRSDMAGSFHDRCAGMQRQQRPEKVERDRTNVLLPI